jgi:hypothetical protein
MIVPIRLCEIKRRIEVWAVEEVETVGEAGFASTSCAIMSAYAFWKDTSGGKISSEEKTLTDLGNAFNGAADAKDALMDTRNNFGDACFDTSLLTEVGNIFTTFSNDDAGIPCTDESTKGQNITSGRRGRSRALRGSCWQKVSDGWEDKCYGERRRTRSAGMVGRVGRHGGEKDEEEKWWRGGEWGKGKEEITTEEGGEKGGRKGWARRKSESGAGARRSE